MRSGSATEESRFYDKLKRWLREPGDRWETGPSVEAGTERQRNGWSEDAGGRIGRAKRGDSCL